MISSSTLHKQLHNFPWTNRLSYLERFGDLITEILQHVPISPLQSGDTLLQVLFKPFQLPSLNRDSQLHTDLHTWREALEFAGLHMNRNVEGESLQNSNKSF